MNLISMARISDVALWHEAAGRDLSSSVATGRKPDIAQKARTVAIDPARISVSWTAARRTTTLAAFTILNCK